MRPGLLYIVFLLVFISCDKEAYAQATQVVNYTTRDGLPSNNIYRTIIDDKGFLWVATDNGIARFDGKRFKVFTTAQGLTDNEIVELHIDSNKVVWAIPFLHTPCYFNEKKQRFENEDTDPELKKIVVGNTISANALRLGGMFFSTSSNNAYFYRKGKTTAYPGSIFPLRVAVNKVIEYKKNAFLLFCNDSVRRFEEGRLTGGYALKTPLMNTVSLQDKVAGLMNDEVVVMKVSGDGTLNTIHRKKFSFQSMIFSFTGKHFALISYSGSKYLIDTATLEIKDEIVNDNPVWHVLEDDNGNTWLSTITNGLIKVQQKKVKTFFPAALSGPFNTVVKREGLLIGGNNSGEIFTYDGLFKVNKVLLTEAKKLDGFVRKILLLPKHVFVSCQAASFLMDRSALHIERRLEKRYNRAAKMAAVINDSTLCLGSHAMAYKYNYLTHVYTDSIQKRVTALCVAKSGDIYIGSTDGIYKWTAAGLYAFGQQHKALSYRTNTIAQSPEGLVWVGLGTDTLVVLREDKPIAFIPLGRTITGSMCKSLYCNRPGEIWLGTNKGLAKIMYQLKDGALSYSSMSFGMEDGLPAEQVNDITSYNDTLYAATQGGICFLPENLKVDTKDIPSFITGIRINGVDSPLSKDYSLAYDDNNIAIDFSGVDLTGFIPHFEYSINNGLWQPTEKIELSRLAPGAYNIQIRAINRNGTPSGRIAEVYFYIKTPFWKNGFFWLLVALVCFAVVIYFLQKRNRERQQQALSRSETEKRLARLEMQALMAQINPHFVFNCLNSIKGLIYEQEYKQADKYLDKFADLLRSTMDNAEASIITLEKEINYLDTYLQLEKLRFDHKFDYEITTGNDIDPGWCYVPAMLLQPYVENAIRHGIRHLDGRKGKITIRAVTKDNQLVFTIDDDGVGRAMARQLKSQRHIEYQSRGMQLSRRRAELYNIEQEVIDKTDSDGNAAGTVIVLRIPLSLQP